jgi:nicotinamide riboside kinase
MSEPLLICLVGAECTGKTTLAQALAERFGGLWAAEYLRSFCAQRGRTPEQSEQSGIMRAQFEQETLMLAQARRDGCGLVFCDTAPLLTAVYSAHYFSDTSLLASAHAVHGRYALHLVLRPDLPWEPDGLQRDSAAARLSVHGLLLHQLQTRRLPHIEIDGWGDARFQAAVLAVGTLYS